MNSGVCNQFLSTVTCNLMILLYGTMCSWGGANFVLLRSEETPLASGPLTTSEAALVVSLLCAGGLAGTLIAMLCVDKFGRKMPILCISIPNITSLALIYVATNKYYLYASRMLTGIGGGLTFILVPIFVSEIASDNVRGMLGSLQSFFFSVGAIAGFVVIDNFDFYTQLLIFMVVPVVFLIVFSFFPESPEFLQQQNNEKLFQKSHQFYRGVSIATNKEKNSEKHEQGKPLSFGDFCTRPAKKALLITLVLTFLNQGCGNFVMVSYATDIFKQAGSTLSPIHSSIVVMFVQLLANVCAALLVDRLGRKVLLLTSTFGTAFGLICVGLYSVYRDQLHEYNWIGIVSFACTVFLQAVAILPLYFVVVTEILPKKIKSFVTAVNLSIIYILAFVLLLFYPIMAENFGMHGCMFFFSAFCIAAGIFTLIFLPETKGQSYESIMKALE